MQQLNERADRIRESAASAYRGLVLEVVENGDQQFGNEDLMQVIAAAGRTLDTFQADVAKVAGRREAVADLAKSEALEPDLADAEAAVNIAVGVVKALEEKHRADMAEARAEMITAGNSRDLLSAQRRTLQSNATDALRRTADPALAAEIDRCKDERDAVQTNRGKIPDPRDSIGSQYADQERRAAAVAQLDARIAELQAEQLDADAFAL